MQHSVCPHSISIKMASSSAATPPVQDPLVEGNSHSICGGNPSQGIQREPPGTTTPGKELGTSISHLITSFTPVNFENKRKTSLVQLFHILDSLQIRTKTALYFEPPRPSHMEGIFCKNIFLKDRKGQFYLVICSETTEIDLKKLKTIVRAHRNFSFSSAEDLDLKLALTPGAVSPFGLLNDPNQSVRFIVDRAMINEAKVEDKLLNFHPIVDFLTTLVSLDDLMKFVKFCGHEIEFADL